MVLISSFLLLSIIVATVFVVGDYLWLYSIIRPFFIPKIRHLMTTNFTEMNYISAIAAYLILSVGLTYFVVYPFLKSPYKDIFLQGAFFGFCMYGIYELTSYALLNKWSLSFVCIDIVWGTVWCGVVSVSTVFIVQYFFKF